jgi:hypothetical protein
MENSLCEKPERHAPRRLSDHLTFEGQKKKVHSLVDKVGQLCGPVAELVGIEGGVVSGVINLESSGVEASDWRPRHDEQYYEA